MTMTPIRGLIFDFDGLILDTETPAFQSWQEIYQEHGCSFSLDAWAVALGTADRGFDPCAALEAQLGRSLDHTALRARRQARKFVLMEALAVLPGVAEYVEAAQRLGLRLGVASSSPRAWVEEHLARFGLLDSFNCVSCVEDVPRAKPDPALYRRTLAALGLRPDEAVAFEDSPNGATAARAAGIFCVAVPNALTCWLPLEHADLRLTSLAEIPLDTLLTRVQRTRPAPQGQPGP